MAPQTSIPTSATVLGLIGTVFWCIQLSPQIYRNWRTKSTLGVPATMMFLWSASGVPFGVYAISQNFNIPLWVQPQCFMTLCMVSWAQCMYYGCKWPRWKAIGACIFLLILCAILEVVLVLVIRGPYRRGVSWPVTTMGILACVMLVGGYIPIPFELVKRRGRVVGIDFLFLTIDFLGAFFSLMSLVAQHTFDIEFGLLYSLCAGIELCMFVSHGIWMLRTRDIRNQAKAAGLTFDEAPEAQAWQNQAFKLSFGNSKSNKKQPESNTEAAMDHDVIEENDNVSTASKWTLSINHVSKIQK